jgi:lactate dehydrogenase-like 2-hydroxyacid dehydrogenase
MMKPDAILLNTARGAVVDIEALAAALENRSLGGAGIDVLPIEPPEVHTPLIRLWQAETNPAVNLILTPHVAFYSEASMSEMRVKAAAGVARVLRGEAPRNCVNLKHIRP